MQSSLSSKSNSLANELTTRISSHSLRFRIDDDNVVECDRFFFFSNVVECDFLSLSSIVECDLFFFLERRRMRFFFFSFESQRNRVSLFVRVLLVARDATANSNLMSNEKRLRTIAQHHMILERLYMTKNRATKKRMKQIEAKKI
jgi:hypothetical protein